MKINKEELDKLSMADLIALLNYSKQKLSKMPSSIEDYRNLEIYEGVYGELQSRINKIFEIL